MTGTTTAPIPQSNANGINIVTAMINGQPAEIQEMNDAFIRTDRPHALLITTHGYAGPRFPVSGPDSGGQITYVNELSRWLVEEGFKVTVATRAFEPDEKYAKYGQRVGAAFFSNQPLARYLYIPGIESRFIPKEQIFAELPAIGHNLSSVIVYEASTQGMKPWEYVSWVNSHYWDGGVVGQFLIKIWQQLGGPNRHSWNAHSIGTLKEENMLKEHSVAENDPNKGLKEKLFMAKLASMNFPMREHAERGIVGGAQSIYNAEGSLYPALPPAAMLVWTSEEIRDHMVGLGRPESTPLIHFPPGTDIRQYYPRESVHDEGVQAFFRFLEGKVPPALLEKMRNNPQEVNVIVEASRMDETKRKHIPIEAMKYLPKNTVLFMTGTRDDQGVYIGLEKTIHDLGLEDSVFLVGFVPDEAMGPMQSLPHGTRDDQFNVAISIGASKMEGWGMSVMDGTAGGMVLIVSDMTPYGIWLVNRDNAAVVIPVTGESGDEARAYADAMMRFIENPAEARAMVSRSLPLARSLYWPTLINRFLTAQGKALTTGV